MVGVGGWRGFLEFPNVVVKGVLCPPYIVAMVHEAWKRASAIDLPNLLSPFE